MDQTYKLKVRDGNMFVNEITNEYLDGLMKLNITDERLRKFKDINRKMYHKFKNNRSLY